MHLPRPLVLARNTHPRLGFRPPPLAPSGSGTSGDGEARGGRIWHRSPWLWTGRQLWQEGRTSVRRAASMEMELLLHRGHLDSSRRRLECPPPSPPVGPHQEGEDIFGQARPRWRNATIARRPYLRRQGQQHTPRGCVGAPNLWFQDKELSWATGGEGGRVMDAEPISVMQPEEL